MDWPKFRIDVEALTTVMWQAAGRGIIGSSNGFMRDERLMKRRGDSREERREELYRLSPESHIDNCRINEFGLYESYVTENSPISYVTCHNPVMYDPRPFSDGLWFVIPLVGRFFPGAAVQPLLGVFWECHNPSKAKNISFQGFRRRQRCINYRYNYLNSQLVL
jgi:hypothetical protein